MGRDLDSIRPGRIPDSIKVYFSGDGKAFVTETGNKKLQNKTQERTSGRNSVIKPTKDLPNIPKELKIIDLNISFSGGREYTALFGEEEKWKVFVRESVLLDTILNVGINAGGLLNGKYVFAALDGGMLPIRVGSEFYKKCLNYTKNRNKKPLELTIGNNYCGVKEDRKYTFLGCFYTVVPYAGKRKHVSWSDMTYPEKFREGYACVIEKYKVERRFFFFKTSPFKKISEVLEENFSKNIYFFESKKTHSLKIDKGPSGVTVDMEKILLLFKKKPHIFNKKKDADSYCENRNKEITKLPEKDEDRIVKKIIDKGTFLMGNLELTKKIGRK